MNIRHFIDLINALYPPPLRPEIDMLNAIDFTPRKLKDGAAPCAPGAYPHGPDEAREPRRSVTEPRGAARPHELDEDAVDSAKVALARAEQSKNRQTYSDKIASINSSNSQEKGKRLADAGAAFRKKNTSLNDKINKVNNNSHD
jgi:hypothetical protein